MEIENEINSNESSFSKVENNQKVNKSYKIEFKINCVEFILSKSSNQEKTEARRKIINTYLVPKTTLSKWEKSYEKYKSIKDMNKKRVAGGGRKGDLEEIEPDIISWVIHMRKAGYPISIKL